MQRNQSNGDRRKLREVCLKRDKSLKKQGGNLEGIIWTTWGHVDQKSELIFTWVNLEDAKLRSSQDNLNRWKEEWPTLLSVQQDVSGDDSEKIYRHRTTAAEASERTDIGPQCPDQSVPSMIQCEISLWPRNTPLPIPRQHKVKRRARLPAPEQIRNVES